MIDAVHQILDLPRLLIFVVIIIGFCIANESL